MNIMFEAMFPGASSDNSVSLEVFCLVSGSLLSRGKPSQESPPQMPSRFFEDGRQASGGPVTIFRWDPMSRGVEGRDR